MIDELKKYKAQILLDPSFTRKIIYKWMDDNHQDIELKVNHLLHEQNNTKNLNDISEFKIHFVEYVEKKLSFASPVSNL